MNLFDYYEQKADLLENEILEFTQLKQRFSEIVKYQCKTQEEKEYYGEILEEIKEELKEFDKEWLAIQKAHGVLYGRFHTPYNYKYYQGRKNDPFFPWDGKY